MGQASDSGRNASLDEQKQRAAGRRGRTGQHDAAREQIQDAATDQPATGEVAGAFGRDNKANRKGGVGTQGGGGGGGEPSPAKSSALDTGVSKSTGRKRT